MGKRIRVSSGGPWEEKVGYSRALRIGAQVAVAGTTAAGPDGEVVGRGDPYVQTRRCIQVIEEALEQAGACLADVIRTRMYVTDIDLWPEIGRAHAEAFGATRPAATMVEVSRLIDPDMLIEIDADAVVADD